MVVKINYLKGVALKEKSKILTILVTIFNNLENYVTASNIVLLLRALSPQLMFEKHMSIDFSLARTCHFIPNKSYTEIYELYTELISTDNDLILI